MDHSEPLLAAPPQNFESLRAYMLGRHEAMPKRLAQVARFALDHPDQMALSTVAELAAAASVQPSTLVRFAQSLGYSGFSELQQVFRSRLRDRWPDYRERLARVKDESGVEPARILDGFIEAATRSLAQLGRAIIPAEFEAASGLIGGARCVYILGQRRAFPAAAYLAYALGKLDLPALLLDNIGGMLDLQAARMGAEDVLLAISFAPYTPSTIEIAERAAARGVRLVAITDSLFSPLSAMAKARLEVVEADFGAFRSLSATMALAMALAIAAAELRNGQAPSC